MRVALGSGYSLTFGEMVAMAGDHFSSIDQMRAFAARKAPGPGGVDELEYVRQVDIGGADTPADLKELSDLEQAALRIAKNDPDLADTAYTARLERRQKGAAAAAAAQKRYYQLAGSNQSHFLQPRGKRSPLADPGHSLTMAQLLAAAGIPAAAVLTGSAANYRNCHVRAIQEAVAAGQTGGDIGSAMAAEAFAAHYLTDSFAGGHVETERLSISAHWNSRVPMFFENLVGYIAETMAKRYAATVTLGPYQLRPDVAYHFGARDEVESALASKGSFTFGDLVSGAVHDVANEFGLKAAVNTGISTELVELYGDGNLGEGDERRLAVEAVSRGVADVTAAFELAKKKPAKSVATILGELASDGVFPAEQILPRSIPGDEPASEAPIWQHDSVEDLFADPRMVEAINLFAAEKVAELATAVEDLDATKKRLFHQYIVNPFRSDPIAMLHRVLAWTPDTGGGALGHNTDDNALDYVEAARAAGGLESLTLDQRRRLIDDLLEGATVGSDEDAVMDLLTSAPDSTARALILEFGWERLHDEIDDFVGDDFAERYPRADYGS